MLVDIAIHILLMLGIAWISLSKGPLLNSSVLDIPDSSKSSGQSVTSDNWGEIAVICLKRYNWL